MARARLGARRLGDRRSAQVVLPGLRHRRARRPTPRGPPANLPSSPEYYRSNAPEEEPLDWYQYSIEGTRRFRALKLWMSWKHLGTRGLGGLVEHNIDLAAYLAERLRAAPDFELAVEPALSVVCFRHLPAGSDRWAPDRADRHQDALQRALEVDGTAWVSTTTLRGRTYLRAGVVNYLATRAEVDAHVRGAAPALRRHPRRARPALNRSCRAPRWRRRTARDQPLTPDRWRYTSATARSFCRFRRSTASYPPPKRDPATCLDLADHERVAALDDQVELADPAAPVPRDHVVPAVEVARVPRRLRPPVPPPTASPCRDDRATHRRRVRPAGAPGLSRWGYRGWSRPRAGALRRSRHAGSSPERSRRTARV